MKEKEELLQFWAAGARAKGERNTYVSHALAKILHQIHGRRSKEKLLDPIGPQSDLLQHRIQKIF